MVAGEVVNVTKIGVHVDARPGLVDGLDVTGVRPTEGEEQGGFLGLGPKQLGKWCGTS